jgi:TRAP-type C4-dicarboxylate transport system permease small subunit
MVAYGASLVKTTYFQAYPEFQYIRVGVAYSAIPIAGLITLLFVIEKVFFRPSLEAAKEGEV